MEIKIPPSRKTGTPLLCLWYPSFTPSCLPFSLSLSDDGPVLFPHLYLFYGEMLLFICVYYMHTVGMPVLFSSKVVFKVSKDSA